MARDPLTKQLIDSGVIDESELPFNEADNTEPDDDAGEYSIPYTLKLNTPIMSMNAEITELIFKEELTVGMITHMPVSAMFGENKIGHFIPIISKMTGHNSMVIKSLKPLDLMNAIGVVTHFLFT